MKRIVVLVIMISMMLVSCDTQPAANGGIEGAAQDQATAEAPAVEEGESAEAPVEEVPEETTRELSPSTEPVEVSFTAADGFELSGMYYPSVYMDSPVIVLMHQANMNMHQWDAIALWLQNAGGDQAGISAYHAAKLMQTEPWQDNSWFPELEVDFSVSVFTFTFRGCENGCSDYQPEGWVMDATAALEEAASMPEVDASRVVAVGSSIGADGAVDGCMALPADSAVNCLESFSLSPGSYMNIDYATVVESSIEMGRNQNCFATKGDIAPAATCGPIEMEGFTSYIEEGSEHGIEMVNPDHEVNILEILRDYLIHDVLS